MTGNLHDYLVYSTDFALINSPAYYDCVVHMICTSGSGYFDYNGSRVNLSKNKIAILAKPRLIESIVSSNDFSCEYIAASDKFLHTFLPANSYAIQGCVNLFDNPVIPLDDTDASKFATSAISERASTIPITTSIAS